MKKNISLSKIMVIMLSIFFIANVHGMHHSTHTRHRHRHHHHKDTRHHHSRHSWRRHHASNLPSHHMHRRIHASFKQEIPLNGEEDRVAHTIAAISQTAHANGCTLLHLLAGLGDKHVETLKKLVGNPNLPDNQGNTPLHIAVQAGEFATTQALLYAGANIRVPNHQGQSPLSIAQEKAMSSKGTNEYSSRQDILRILDLNYGRVSPATQPATCPQHLG